jgi:predicted transcriptional regulator
MAESTPSDRIPITIEITLEQKRRIEQLAERKDVSPEAVVRNAIARWIDTASAEREESEIEPEPGSFLDGIEHLAGSVDDPEAPSDLSSNPEHMEGYGRS